MYTLMSTCLAVLFAAILTQTRKSEVVELQQLERKTKEDVESYIFEAEEREGAGEDSRSNTSS